MDAVTAFAIVAGVGLALIVVGAILHVQTARRPRAAAERAEPAATKNPIQEVVEAFVWAFRTALKRFFAILGKPGEHTGGQFLMTVGVGIFFIGVLGLLVSLLIGAGGDDDGGTTGTTA